MSRLERLDVIGADANNLRDIDCNFPLVGMTAIVGVSGSGKSSLLHDVIAAEATRRNILFHRLSLRDSGDAMVRAFVSAIPAMLYVGQRPFRSSSRTTIGTATGLLEDLRTLFLEEAQPVTESGDRVPPPSPDSFADWLVQQYRGTATVWTVPLRWTRSDGQEAARALTNAGIRFGVLRSETDSPEVHKTGRKVPLANWKPLRTDRLHSLEAIIGTVSIEGPDSRQAVFNLVDAAWGFGGQDVIVELHAWNKGPATDDDMGCLLDGRKHQVHPASATMFRIPDRHLLSFNAPNHPNSGACPVCKGIGRCRDINLDALIAAPEKSPHEGAIALWTAKNYKHVNIQHDLIEGLRGRNGFDPDEPWRRLPEAARDMILEGTGNDLIQGIDPKTGKKQGAPRKFEGFRNAILRRVESPASAARLADYVHEGPCPACKGTRWSPAAAALRVAGLRLPEWLALPMNELARAAGRYELSPDAHRAMDRVSIRAEMLSHLGLGHLSADRGMLTISDGESRRLQIGAVLAASAKNLLLLLDEPARGLHEQDLGPMISILKELSRRHCVLLNEHRSQLVAAADRVLALGPGGGPDGGRIVPEFDGFDQSDKRLNEGGKAGEHGWLDIAGASIHNVRDQDVSIPLGALTSIAGVSGSGKSSFALGVLVPALSRLVSERGDLDLPDLAAAGRWESISGDRGLKKVHVLHQRVPPRNRRSLVSTMTGVMEILGKAYAKTREAHRANLNAKDFSLNGGTGRCPVCLGLGTARGDENATCPGCGGERFGIAALAPRVDGLTITETLNMPVSKLRERRVRFGRNEQLVSVDPLLETMEELGLGHIALGRRVDSLSGGEVQRIRVAQILAGAGSLEGHFFFLDEPAAGLHRQDSDRLMKILNRMVDGGRNTVVIVEHNLHVLRAVDWLIEFGPGAGPEGGKVIATGCPADLVARDTPTGQALAHKTRSPTRNMDSMNLLHREGVHASLDRIVDGDIDEIPPVLPVAMERLLDGRRLWEVGDLNLEVGKLILDEWDRKFADSFEKLLELWNEHPEARIAINPALPEMRIWGKRLPHNAVKAMKHRVRLAGLVLSNDMEGNLKYMGQHPGTIRAWFDDSALDHDSRQTTLTRALAIGGGFAELQEPGGSVLATVYSSPIDSETGQVGPAVVALEHLSRFRPEGRCPSCKGEGTVLATSPELLLKSCNITSVDHPDDVLTPDAVNIFRGIWRSDVRPFFRRLEEEGLDDRDAMLDRLLYGFWARPDHGSFLRNPKADPAEVGSWLRWDGLYCSLWNELPRSTSAIWRNAVERERHQVICPVCNGSGHTSVAGLLFLQERSLADWAMHGRAEELRAALEKLPLQRHREKATRSRILDCLPKAGKLGAPASEFPEMAYSVRDAFVLNDRS